MIKQFMEKHYRHFNAATCVDAAQGWVNLLEGGGKMFLTLAGAMSTAELGISVAELIRQGKVHAITCTGANLEEDIFNLVAHNQYRRIPNYRDLTKEQETELLQQGLNRVTDTCIPEEAAMRKVERQLIEIWKQADSENRCMFPFEAMYELVRRPGFLDDIEGNVEHSWIVAAAEKNLPIFTPGWEDSTLGNFFAAAVIKGQIKQHGTIKSGVEQMIFLVDWYRETSAQSPIGFFQIGGGIAGDFPICVVPLIQQDLKEDVRLWAYFCQISDSTTSYGSYSGAVPNEKITWGKIAKDTPSYLIESDATIVAPLIFSYVLES